MANYAKSLFLVGLFLQPWFFGGLIRFELLLSLTGLLFLAFRLSHVNVDYMRISKWQFGFIVLLGIAFFVPPLMHGTGDISYIKKYIYMTVVAIGIFAIVLSLDIKYLHIDQSLKLLVVFSFVFFVSSFLYPPMQDFALSLKGETYGIEHKLEYYRLLFPTSFHTFHLGLFFFACYLYLFTRKFYAYALLAFLCAAVSGRSALLLCFISTFVILIYRKPKLLIPGIAVAAVSVALMMHLAESYIEFRYAFEPILNVIEVGSFESKSTDNFFINHLYYPGDREFYFGAGRYTDELTGAFFGATDSGIVRPLLYGGVVFQILYLIALYFLCRIWKYVGNGWLFLFLIFLSNVKAEVLIPSPLFSLLIVIMFVERQRNFADAKIEN